MTYSARPATNTVDVEHNALRLLKAKQDGYASRLASLPAEIRNDAISDYLAPAKPILASDALYGPIGDWCQMIAPHTEANTASLLFSAVVAIGTLIGRSPSITLDGARHGVNFFVILVGDTSTGRKGTAVSRVRRLLEELDREYSKRNLGSGLSSGQGLIYLVRDSKASPNSKKVLDAGVSDKRVLILEAELAGALRQMKGRENTLSLVLREAWDGNFLRTLTKGDPLTATDPHIGIVGQITPEELRRQLEDVELHNGFLNRFLMAWSERSRLHPFGSEPDVGEQREVIARLRTAITQARQRSRLDSFTPAAHNWWEVEYERLTTSPPGRLGAATQRAAAQVRRLSLLFAVLDAAPAVDLCHLVAANALVEYATASARYVLGAAQLSLRAIRIADALFAAGSEGLDTSAIRDHVIGSHHIPARDVKALLSELRDAGLIDSRRVETLGRPREVWYHKKAGQDGQ